MKQLPKKVLATVLACGMLLPLAACNKQPELSEMEATATTTSATKATTTTTTLPQTGTPPVIEKVEGDNPLESLMYTPDVSTLSFSTEAVIPGDPDFEVGKYYTGPTVSFRQSDEDTARFGLWVWDTRVIIGESASGAELNCDVLLDMMLQNGINHVYLHLGGMQDLRSLEYDNGETYEGMVSEMMVRGFIKKCYGYGIRVSALVDGAGESAGRYFGFDGETTYGNAKQYLASIASFNSRAKDESERFCGIQYDVEPDWNGFDGRAANVQYAANFFTYIRQLYDIYDLELDFCINAWTKESDMVVDEDGNVVNMLDVLTKKCDTLTVMSYRPSASEQFDIGSLELEYGNKNGCLVVLGSETMSPDDLSISDRKITYWRYGIAKMSEEQTKLRQMMADAGYEKVGGAIHHAECFYAMTKEKP